MHIWLVHKLCTCGNLQVADRGDLLLAGRSAAATVYDIVRGSIVCHDERDVICCLIELMALSLEDDGMEVVRGTNLFQPSYDPRHSFGYRDISVNMLFSFDSLLDRCAHTTLHCTALHFTALH